MQRVKTSSHAASLARYATVKLPIDPKSKKILSTNPITANLIAQLELKENGPITH